MYKINTGINKFVTGVIQNAGWILVVFLTMLILAFAQLSTQHKLHSTSIHEVVNSYEEYGITYDVEGTAPENVVLISISEYYDNLILSLQNRIVAAEGIVNNPLSTSSARINAQRDIDELQSLITRYESERRIIRSGVIRGLHEQLTEITIDGRGMKWTYTSEYKFNRIISVVGVDVYSWVMSILIAVTGVVIKIQGTKTGKMSGLKLIWKTTLRHATLSEKISPHSKRAEETCEEMNQVELFTVREKRLSYVALKYDDVFTEEGTFRDNINFVKPLTITYKTLKGKTKYKEDKYQKKLLKKQRVVVEKLKSYYPVEIHIHNLLETKQIYKERFDLGISIERYEKTKVLKNIFTSALTITPMITAVSVFVYTDDTMNLVIAIVGTIINLSALIINMFSSFAFITETYQDALIKKCDLLLQIGNQLRLTDDKDNHWNDYIEKEELKNEQIKVNELRSRVG